MPRKSTKENKSIYQMVREEELGLTRAQASEMMEGLSESQIEKIENGKTATVPGDVLMMARAYKRPDLCNYYCSNECPIGQVYVPEIKAKNLQQIVLEMLSSLNSLNRQKERLIEITADGEIQNEELMDFAIIQKRVKEISVSANALQLWIDNTIAAGKIDVEEFERLLKTEEL